MKQKSIKSNTILNLIKSVTQIVFPIITFPYISRVLLAENIGKLNFGSSIISYVTLVATLGVSTYAVRECSRVRDDREQLGKTASQIFSINLITTILAYIGLAVALVFVRKLDDYRLLICIQSASVMFSTLGADWLNSAMEDFKYITIRTVSFQALSIAAMLLFVHKPSDYIIYAIISVVASSGASVLNIFYRRRFCGLRFTLDMNIAKHLPPILTLFALVLSQTIFCSSDVTILGWVRGDREVGLYTTAVKLYNMVNTTIASIAFVVMPRMSKMFNEENYDEINRLFRYSFGFVAGLGLPCIVGINMLCPEIIEILSSAEFLEATGSLRVLTIALAASLLGGLLGNILLIPSGKDAVSLGACVAAAIVNIITNLIFIPKYGMIAAAATTALSQVVAFVISLFFIDKRIRLEKPLKMLAAPALGCVGIAASVLAVSRFTDSLWVKTIVSIALSVTVYAAILLLMKNEFAMEVAAPIVNRIKRDKKNVEVR